MATDLLSQNAPLIADLRANMTSQQFRMVLLPLLRNFFANSSGQSRLITLAQGLAQLLPMRGAQQVLVARCTAHCCMKQFRCRLSPWSWACRSASGTLRLLSSQPDDHSSCSMHWYVLTPHAAMCLWHCPQLKVVSFAGICRGGGAGSGAADLGAWGASRSTTAPETPC